MEYIHFSVAGCCLKIWFVIGYNATDVLDIYTTILSQPVVENAFSCDYIP